MTLAFTFLLAAIALPADLEAVKAEPNLERRSEKALANADKALNTASKAYKSGDMKQVATSLDEVEDSVELSQLSLRETGKSPRRSPKYFKSAEIKVRRLLRRLDGLRHEMSIDERALAEKVIHSLQQVHEALLEGIMSKKR